jgi:glucose-1-phosphate cytidylyltransferase
MVKEYFANYFLHMSDVTFDMKTNGMEIHQKHVEPWRVTLVDTGDNTMTGGRLKRVRDYIGDETFCMTYGDGVADIALDRLIAFHKDKGLKATVTAIRPPGRYGALDIDGAGHVRRFQEKPAGDGAWINGGFFVLEASVFDYIADDSVVWEDAPMQKLAAEGQMAAYQHQGFWQPMDTLREKNRLESLWSSGAAPWKIWA